MTINEAKERLLEALSGSNAKYWAFSPAVRTLLDELEAKDRRVAELERSETQLISERDDAESALNDAYKAVMGQPPEWSNWFSFENAIDEIELACELWRNQTDDVIQFRQRIAELENSETQLINERDAAEYALADMYQAATGERPEWSNMFGFVDAVDVVEERLATLEANQSQTTPTGIQLITEAIGAHGYIVGCLLQGRPDLALEESRKWVSAFGQAAEIVSAQDAAGIKVKG